MDGLPIEGRLGLDLEARGDAVSERLPALDGEMTLSGVAVRMPDTPPVEGLDARVVLKGAQALVRDTSFRVGGAPMTLEADVADVNAPEVRFALDAPELPLSALGVVDPGTEADDVLRALRVVGRADLRGEALVADARFASPEGRLQAIDYRALEGSASVDGDRMQLDELKAKVLGGEVRLAGLLDASVSEAPRFDGRARVEDVRIEEWVRARFPAAGQVVSGGISTSFALSGQQLADTDALLRSLSGSGKLRVQDGMLYDVNVAEEVLRGATGVPGLSAWVSPGVREKHPRVFSTGDTRFETVRAGFEVAKGLLRTDDFALDTGDFGLRGGGTVGLDGSLALSTEFTSSPALATSLVGAARPTRYLLDRSGRLVVPVRIEGTLTEPSVKPDSRFIADAVTRAAVGTATSAITGLLGGGRGDDAREEADEEAASEEAPSPEPEQAPDLESEIKKGLEGLF
jgi:hypothetical protein